MASELYIGGNAADGTPIAAIKTVLINPATGLPFTPNGNGQQIVQLVESIPVTATAAAGSGVTATLPAGAAGKFTYMTYLQIILYASAAITAAAAPLLVTTTNLPNSPVFTFPTAVPAGTAVEQKSEGVAIFKGNTAATAITVVCPAQAGAIWRVNAGYFIA